MHCEYEMKSLVIRLCLLKTYSRLSSLHTTISMGGGGMSGMGMPGGFGGAGGRGGGFGDDDMPDIGGDDDDDEMPDLVD